MKKDELIKAAESLRQARINRLPIAPLRLLWPAMTIDEAYQVQMAMFSQDIAEGAQRKGAKIGLTSPAVQKQMGVDQPDFGYLLDSMQYQNNAIINVRDLIQPKAEAEIAFILKKDISDPDIAWDKLPAMMECAVGAIEIVDSRIADWNISITDTVADNASSGRFVLGEQPKKLSELDLVNCAMTMTLDGRPQSTGRGSHCLGHPLIAVQWLAKTLALQGMPLQAGDIILSGALGPMVNITPGDSLVANIDGLAPVSIRLNQA